MDTKGGLALIGILIISLVVALLLNILGIYLLYHCKYSKKQRLMLSSLSACTIVLTVVEIVYWIGELAFGLVEEESRFLQCLYIFDLGIFTTYYLTVLVITLYRFIVFAFPFTYKNYLTPRNVIKVLSTTWIIGILSSIPFFIINYDLIFDIFYKYIVLSLDFIVVTSAIITYSFIMKRLMQQKRTLEKHRKQSAVKNCQTERKNVRNARFLKVFFLILLSFFILVVIPDVVFVVRQVILGYWDKPYEEDIISFVWGLNYIADPLIYIFLQTEVRKVLRKRVLRLCRRYQSGESLGVSRITINNSCDDPTELNVPVQ